MQGFGSLLKTKNLTPKLTYNYSEFRNEKSIGTLKYWYVDLVFHWTKFSLYPIKLKVTLTHKITASFNEAKSNLPQLKIRSRLLIQQYHEGVHMALHWL